MKSAGWRLGAVWRLAMLSPLVFRRNAISSGALALSIPQQGHGAVYRQNGRLASRRRNINEPLSGFGTEFRTLHMSNAKDQTSTQPQKPQTTLATGLHESEMEIKKSRFIGYAQHVDSWEETQNVIQTIRAIHPKARHVCFGMYVLQDNGVEQERCSDDGEPTGTAGVPVLGAIKGEALANVCCCVVRYFGGIKLGAGGLIRAYGGAARLVLREAPTKVLLPKSTLHVKLSSAFIGNIYDTVQRVGGTVSDEEYDEHGDLTLTTTCETKHVSKLKESIQDATKGNAVWLDDR